MVKKILICAPAWLGDLIMSHSLIRTLYQAGHELHVLAPEWNFSALQYMPEITKQIKLPMTHGDLKLKNRYLMGKSLRQENYCQAIICQNSLKSALIPFFAKIPIRTGWLREGRKLLLTDGRKLDKKLLPLMVQRYVALAYSHSNSWNKDNFLWPRLNVPKTIADDTLTKYQLVKNKKILALCPGAAYGPTKRWPSEYYAYIAKKKLQEGWQIWLFGSAQDRLITDEIMQLTANQCTNLTGDLKLDETIGLFSVVDALISNDSGLLHVAAALDKPVIGVYGSTSPDFTPPLSKNAQTMVLEGLECRPCFQRTCRYAHLNCLTQIKPEMVNQRLNQIFTSD